MLIWCILGAKVVHFEGICKFWAKDLCKKMNYFGTPLPLRGGFPPNVQSRPTGHTQSNLFSSVLRTLFNTAYLLIYASILAYKRSKTMNFIHF